MSTRRVDDSRPGSTTSQRNTARDVPAAKLKDGAVGTVAPRGLRGPSLVPGQGAPERIVPEEIELAVLRDAETLDGPRVARAAAKRLPAARAPSPTPVSVEVPRARSIPPALVERSSTPPSPSARSIQSGTLMSIGSVDPRAPTELSLPSPRPLSVSERAAYLGPEAVVDRTPVQARHLPAVSERSDSNFSELAQRSLAPRSEPSPQSSSRSSRHGSAAVSSARPSAKSESAPAAQRRARSYPPPSPALPYPPPPTPRPPPGTPRSNAPSQPPSAPRFQIHSELEALPHQIEEDVFDLRSASTQREPLAGRKQQDSTDWSDRPSSSDGAYATPEPSTRSVRRSSSELAESPRAPDYARRSSPEFAQAPRASVPIAWVLGAALFALLVAGLVAFILRPTSSQNLAPTVDAPGTAAAPASRLVKGSTESTASALPAAAARGSVSAAVPNAAPRRLAPKTAASARPMVSAVPEVVPQVVPETSPEAVPPSDANTKQHSIY